MNDVFASAPVIGVMVVGLTILLGLVDYVVAAPPRWLEPLVAVIAAPLLGLAYFVYTGAALTSQTWAGLVFWSLAAVAGVLGINTVRARKAEQRTLAKVEARSLK